jgi:DNA polymerase (family 10)
VDPKSKTYTNPDIAEFLTNIATALEIKNKNRFKIAAYQNAADSILTYPESVQQIWQKDPQLLDQIPGVGESIFKKLDYLFRYHKIYPSIIKINQGIHPAVFTLTKINGVGPKIAHKLTQKLKFPKDPQKALEKLIYYAQNGKIRKLRTFGEKSESMILDNTLNFVGRKRRLPLVKAKIIADNIISYLKLKFPQVEFYPLGSLRRQSTTVGDIDIAAKSQETQKILDCFINYPLSVQTVDRGPKKASIRLKNDVRIDIMVQPPSTWGSLLQHLTGSKQHNIILRRYALKLGYSISEYGIKDLKNHQIYTFDNEKDLYHFLRLCYIEPQDRLGENEIDLAQKCYTNTIKD